MNKQKLKYWTYKELQNIKKNYKIKNELENIYDELQNIKLHYKYRHNA